jgi:adenylate kinase
LKRLTGRRSCRKCGAVYHLTFNPPKKDGICDVCGGELYQRHDDTDEVIKARYEVYKKQTSPLIDYYTKAGKLIYINGAKDVSEVFKEVSKAVAS